MPYNRFQTIKSTFLVVLPLLSANVVLDYIQKLKLQQLSNIRSYFNLYHRYGGRPFKTSDHYFFI